MTVDSVLSLTMRLIRAQFVAVMRAPQTNPFNPINRFSRTSFKLGGFHIQIFLIKRHFIQVPTCLVLWSVVFHCLASHAPAASVENLCMLDESNSVVVPGADGIHSQSLLKQMCLQFPCLLYSYGSFLQMFNVHVLC